MTEMQLIDESLRRIYRSKQDKCVCTNSVSQQCWYKFGFAFIREITPSDGIITDLHSSDHCPINSTFYHSSTTSFNSMTPEEISNYGQNYARIIRERWNFAECGEDFLILIIQKRPKPLSRNSENMAADLRPIIFLSYGSIIHEKLSHLHLNGKTSIHTVVETENSHLQNGYPLNRVLINLIERLVTILKDAEDLPQYPRQKSHVPFWAWMCFLACFILCVFMTIGLCWIRSTTRRSSQRGKPGIVATNGRSWKAGFGDDQPTSTNTNVNLVQMLFPKSRNEANNV
uniref:Uncharacterized protein n=1 Tax=Panagrolaimus sp. PS1159 TaxID=55785 RepID=A0AC35FL96_9BILA